MALGSETVLERFVTEFVFRSDPKQLDRIERRVEAFRGRLNQISNVGIVVGGALTTAAGATLKSFSEYETGFAEMAAKTGKSMTELQNEYGTAVQNISRETGISLNEIQAGFQKGLSAGLEGQELIEAVTMAAKSQAAGIGSLEDTISSATTAWSVLGEDAAEAMDTITEAAQIGEGETADFGRALKGLVGFAKTLNIDFEELAGGIAAVSQSAKSVPEGETQFRAFLKGLASPSEGAIKTLKDLNAAFTFGDLRDIVEEEGLAAAFSTLKQFIADLETQGIDVAPIIADLFPEVEAQQFFNTVDPGKIRDLTDAIRESEGAIQAAFAEGENTVNRNWNTMIADLKVAAVILGAEVAPAFLTVANKVSELTDAFINADPWVHDMVGAVLTMGPAIVGASLAIRGISFVLGGLVPVLKAGLWLFGGLGAVASLLGAPVWLVAGALLAVGAAAWYFKDEIGAAFSATLGWLKRTWKNDVERVRNVWNLLTERPDQTGDQIFAWIHEDWERSVSAWEGVFDGFLEYLGTDKGQVFGWLQERWDQFWKAAWNLVPAPIRRWFEGNISEAQEANEGTTADKRGRRIAAAGTGEPQTIIAAPEQDAETLIIPEETRPTGPIGRGGRRRESRTGITSAVEPQAEPETLPITPEPEAPVATGSAGRRSRRRARRASIAEEVGNPLAAPLPAAPAAAVAAGRGGGGGETRTSTTNINVGDVIVNTNAQTADELYRDSNRELRRSILQAYEGFDSQEDR